MQFLQNAGMLVDESDDELEELIRRNKTDIADTTGEWVFTIVASSYCNMGCSYCGQRHTTEDVKGKFLDSVTSRISTAMRAPTTRAVNVGWFGGEPLLAGEALIAAGGTLYRLARELGIKWRSDITTNGSLLSESLIDNLFEDAGVTEMCITLDGPERVHNARRRLRNGKGSFSHILRMVRYVRDAAHLEGMRVVLRANIDKMNAPFVNEFLQLLADQGCGHARIFVDLHPVYSWSNDVSAVELDHQDFAEAEIDWMIHMLRLGLRFSAIPTAPHSVVCVAISQTAEVLSPSGKVLACTEHPLVEKHESGDFLSLIDEPWQPRRASGPFADFNERVRAQQYPCHSCNLFGICGGACPKHWPEGIAPCPSFKYNIQARMDIAAVMNGLRPVCS
jgi:uncharacterized protein